MEVAAATVRIEIPRDVLVDAVAKRLDSLWVPIQAPAFKRPTIIVGSQWHGGKTAGVTLHNDDPHALILLPGEFRGSHEIAAAWATEQGGYLPSRFDGIVLFNALKAEFKDEAYWLAEPRAGHPSFAWYQDFYNGSQWDSHESNELLAVAVRRVSL